MFSLSEQLPKYLLGKNQLTGTVLFAALFSLVFMLLRIPYSDNVWFQLGRGQKFLFTIAFFLLAAMTVCTSKRIQYKWRTKDFTYARLILWDVCEVTAISLMYTAFTIAGEHFGLIDLGQRGLDSIFGSAFLFVAISLGVPYVIASQYFAIEEKNNTIRLMNLQNAVCDIDLEPHQAKRITLFDNSGVLKFSTTSENLFFIESDDNYVKVWYSDNSGRIKQYMLRCRLKTIEDSFADSELVRCHRKYIVNISKVRTLTSEKDGYVVNLDLDSVEPIPVSRTYESAILAKFNSR